MQNILGNTFYSSGYSSDKSEVLSLKMSRFPRRTKGYRTRTLVPYKPEKPMAYRYIPPEQANMQKNPYLKDKLALRSITSRPQQKKLNSFGLSENEIPIKIHIEPVESIQFTSKPFQTKTYLDIDYSTMDSSYKESSSNNTPSPIPSLNTTPLRTTSKVQRRPARHLTLGEMEKVTKSGGKKSVKMPTKSLDVSSGLAAKDKKEFENELLFRKYREHKVMKNLRDSDEEDWEWASYGDSPTHKVRFIE